MRYILTIVFLSVSTLCFGQAPPINDSIRAARMEQVRRMMEEQRQRGGGQPQRPMPQRAAGPANTAPPPAQPAVPPIVTSSGGAVPEQNAVQDENARWETIRAKLDTLAVADEAYAQQVEELSVSGLPLGELLRNIARVYSVNINVRGVDNISVMCNFSRARITDLLYFLCKEYDLDIDVTGNIVSVFRAAAPPPAPKVIGVFAGDAAGTVSFDLEGDRLADVMRRMTSVGRINFIIPNALNDRPLSGHGRDLPVEEAVVAIASANGLRARRNDHGIWELADSDATNSFRRESAFNEDQLYVDSLGRVTAHIAGGNVQEIITELCGAQGLNYFFLTPINHSVPLDVDGVTFEMLLGIMFAGTEYGYYREQGVYMFGKFDAQTLGSVRVIPLVYRSVSKIDEIIPAQLKEGLELKTFVDLNSVIASGDQRRVLRVENFLRSIDKRVPLVTIEVMIMDVTKSVSMEAGLGLGVTPTPSVTSGTLSPGLNMNLGSQSINSIIDNFGGFGSINLGKVTPQFYMNLKALEDNGTIEMHSTPKLSTLNGNPANLTSGEKNYYKEMQTNYWGSQTPTPSESYTWKEIEANLEINITPFVSDDGLITLEIEIVQSEFTDRVEPNGPYGMATRSFKSTIRVQNEEVVLLGGIDRNNRTVDTQGLPFISRVPVLKWIFGNSKREKKEHKLNVFIKPTLIE
jgi:type IV pilus assembly protein PilQ